MEVMEIWGREELPEDARTFDIYSSEAILNVVGYLGESFGDELVSWAKLAVV